MDRSRIATINSACSISHEPVNKQIYLTQYGLMAERHWRKFRPKMVRELEAKSTLMEALFEAQERTIEEMEALTRKLETEQKLTPQQAHDRAIKVLRGRFPSFGKIYSNLADWDNPDHPDWSSRGMRNL